MVKECERIVVRFPPVAFQWTDLSKESWFWLYAPAFLHRCTLEHCQSSRKAVNRPWPEMQIFTSVSFTFVQRVS